MNSISTATRLPPFRRAGRSVASLIVLALCVAGTYFFPATASQAAAPSGGRFNALTPARLADTRPGSGQAYSGQILGAGQTFTVRVSGAGGVPSTGVTAVVLNLTAVASSAATFLTVYPSDIPRPTASTVNPKAWEVANSQTTVRLGDDGGVKIYNYAGNTHVLLDVLGYYSATGDRFIPTTPVRLADTRSGTGTPSSGKTLTSSLPLDVNFGLVADPRLAANKSATAVVLSVTMVQPQGAGHLTVFPSGSSLPGTSSLNYVAGQSVAKEVTVKLGLNGSFSVSKFSPGSADVIIDVLGYYVRETIQTGEFFTALSPTRITDTRASSGQIAAGMTLQPHSTLRVNTRFVAGIPAGATGLVFSLTALNGTAATYLTAYSDEARPNASQISLTTGQIAYTEVTTKLADADRGFTIYNAAGTVDVIVDVLGYYFTSAATLSYYKNACPPGTRVHSMSDVTILSCIARGGSTSVSPLAQCPESFDMVTITGACADVAGHRAGFVPAGTIRNGVIRTGNGVQMTSVGTKQAILGGLTDRPDIQEWRSLAWSPSGTQFFFTYNGEVHSVDKNGAGMRKLALRGALAIDVSKDGKRLAVVSSEAVQPDGKRRLQIFDIPSNRVIKTFTYQAASLTVDFFPGDLEIFSTLLFPDGAPRDCRITIADEATTCSRGVTGSVLSAVLSPDGTRVAYEKRTADTANIFVSDLDGSNERQLTFWNVGPDGEGASYPDWSPDGKSVLYRAPGAIEMYRVNLDGSFHGRVANTGQARYLWQPLPS